MTMTKTYSIALSLFLSLFSTCQLLPSLAANPVDGFSVELIHRDSPKSPLYQPNQIPSERFEAAVNRSIIRSRHFSLHERSMAELTSTGTGGYYMKIGMGTPPVEVLLLLDTTCPLIWTQCELCAKCFSKRPLFNPGTSSTYRNITYSLHQCKLISSVKTYGDSNGACMYEATYNTGSFSRGNLAIETLAFGSNSLLPSLIGCSHENGGDLLGASGIIGLDFSYGSLISQLGPVIKGMFSICLSPFWLDRPSRTNFGSNAVVSGPNVVSTPLYRKPNAYHYFVTFEAISVAGTRLAFPDSTFGGTTQGNIIIDTGTTLTHLPMNLYKQMETEVDKLAKAEKVAVNSMGLCYKASPRMGVSLPLIRLHFTGAEVNLGQWNSFPRVSEGIVRFSFIGSPTNAAVYGSMGQANFLIGF